MLLIAQVNFMDEKAWPLLALAGFALLYVVIRPMLRRKDPLERSSSGMGKLSQQRAVERQMSSLLVDLSEMARQISAQLDTRAARLEALIREADDKIAELRGTTGGHSSAAPLDSAPMRLVPDAPAEDDLALPAPPRRASPDSDTRHVDVYALADQGLAVAEIAQQLNRPKGEIELIIALRPRAEAQ